jgi:hypothetical protein
MPGTTQEKVATADQQRAVVRGLNQSVAAELIDKPSVWLRDNVNVAARNDDGTYNGPQLVANLLKALPVAALSDELLEGVNQVVECCQPYGDRHDVALAALQAVEDRHGSAGLAAVGAEMVKHFRRWCELDPHSRPQELPAEEAYVAEVAAKAEVKARQRYATISAGWTARQQGRQLFVCELCKKYRMGSRWLSPPLPTGYVPHDLSHRCDKCSGAVTFRGRR